MKREGRISLVFSFVFLILLASIFPASAQDAVSNQAGIHVISNLEQTGLDISFNSTTGMMETTPSEKKNLITITGKTEDSGELLLVQPADPLDPNTSLIQTKHSFTTGTVEVNLGLAITHYIPLRGGSFVSQATALMEEKDDEIKETLENLLAQEANPPPSRRRSVRNWASTSEIDGDLAKSLLEQQTQMVEDETPENGRTSKRSFISNGPGATLTKLYEILGIDPEGSDDDMVYLPKEGAKGWKRRKHLSPTELAYSRIVIKAKKQSKQVEEELEKHKRGLVDISTGIAAAGASNAMNTDLFDEVGGVCPSLKYGTGVVSGLTEACLIGSVDYIYGTLTATNDAVVNLNQRMETVTSALGEVNSALNTMSDIQKLQGDQINLLQEQTDIIREESLNTNFRINDLSRAVNQQAYATELLAANDLKMQSSVTRLEYVMEKNLETTSDRFVGMSQLNNEMVQGIQNQMSYLETQLNANMDQIILKTYTDFATLSAQNTQSLRKLQLDTDVRLNLLINDINLDLTEKNRLLAEMAERMRLIENVVSDEYKSIRDLYNQFFSVGTAFVDYFVYKKAISQQTNDTFVPIVLEGTGRPPPNMANYTAWDGAKLEFMSADAATCELTESEMAQVNTAVQNVLDNHAVLPLLLPLSLHPEYVRFSGNTSQFSSNSVQSSALVRYLIRAAVRDPNDPSNITYYLLSSSSAASGTFNTWWIRDRGGARNDNRRLSCFFINTQGVVNTAERVVREGDRSQIACYIGLNLYMMTLTKYNTTYRLNFTLAAPPQDSNYTFELRTNCTVLSKCKENYLMRTPLSQYTFVTPLPLLPSGTTYLNSKPEDVVKLSYASNQFSGGGPFTTTSETIFEGISFLQDFIPRPDSTNITQTFLTDQQANATVTKANEENSGVTYQRKRRAVTYPAASLSTCYDGIEIETTVKLSYRQLSNSQKQKAQTCTAKPGCMYAVLQEPVSMQTFTGAGFTGTTQRFYESIIPTDYYGAGMRSAIIPPSLNPKSYVHPIESTDKRCYKWWYQCDLYLQVDQCFRVSEIPNPTTHPGYCGTYYGTTGDHLYSWNLQESTDPYYSQYTASYQNDPGEVCPTSNVYSKYTPFCKMAILGETVTQSPPSSGTLSYACQPQNFRVGYCGSGTTFKGCLTTTKEPVSNAKRSGFPTGMVLCKDCKTGYGQESASGNSGAAIFGSCPPKTQTYRFGGNSGPFTFDSGNSSTAYSPALLVKTVTGKRQWHGCFPDDGTMVDVPSNENGTLWEKAEFPYFFAHGDLPTGGKTYQPLNARIISLYPNCDTLQESNCIATDTRTEFCEVTIDSNITLPSPVPANMYNKCSFVNKDVCRNITNTLSCIRMWKTNSKGTKTPICTWTGNTCLPMNKNILGSTLVAPATSTATTSTNYIACAYRDPTNPYHCTYDQRCYHYVTIPAPGVTGIRECREADNIDATMGSGWVVPTTYAQAISKLQAMNFTGAAECFGPRVVCSLQTAIQTLRLQLTLSVANNITEESASLCSQFATEPEGLCDTKVVVRNVNWTLGFPTSNHQAEFAVNLCVRESTQCRDNCLVFGKDTNRCLERDYCFASRLNFQCYQDQLQYINQVCPSRPSSNNDIGSNCIKRGNQCTLLMANRTVTGTPFIVASNISEATNDANLETSECAVVAGVVSGDLATASTITRLSGVTLPTAMAKSCMAVANEQGVQCYPAALVGTCKSVDICNMLNDPLKRLNDLANGATCGFEEMTDCVLYTDDGNDFPCAWVQASGSFSYCTFLYEAQKTTGYGSVIKVITSGSYMKENYITSARFDATVAQLTQMSINIADIDTTGAGNPATKILMLGPPKIVCPDEGYRVQGYGCCVGDACLHWKPNPWHPKYAYFEAVKSLCHTEIPKVSTFYSVACISKVNQFNLNPDGTRDSYYVCEPLISEEGRKLFNFASPTERAREQITLETTTPLLYPLKKYKTSGSAAADVYPIWREFTHFRKFTYINTDFCFDTVFDLNVTSLTSDRIIFRPYNSTSVISRQVNGMFHHKSVVANSLQSAIDTAIDIFATAQRAVDGPYPQAWRTRPDYGCKVTSVHPGTAKSGKRMAKATRVNCAFVEKDTFVPVYKVIEITDHYTASMTTGNGQPVPPVSIQVTNNYASLLPALGETFVFFDDPSVDPLHIYGAGHELIGQPGDADTLSYIYAEEKGEFDRVKFLETNPHFDPDRATRFLSQYISERVPGAIPGSANQMCGKNVINRLQESTDEVRKLILKLNLAYDSLDSNGKDFWQDMIDTRTLTELEKLVDTFKAGWSSLGCPVELVNFIDPGDSLDLFHLLVIEAVNSTSLVVNQQKMILTMRPLVEAKNRVQCGNCVILVDSNGDPVESRPNTDVCSPTYGTSYPEPPPKLNAIDLLKFNLPFCNRASYYNITFDPVNLRLNFKLNKGLGNVEVSFETNQTTTIFQLTATTICVVIGGASTDVEAGVYKLKVLNPYSFSVTFDVRVGQNATRLKQPAVFSDACNKDFPLSLPPFSNATISVPVCSNQAHFVQVYSQQGKPCSQVYEGFVDYTATFVNQTANIVLQESEYTTTLLTSTKNLVKSIADLSANTEVKFNQTELKIKNSLIEFSSGPLLSVIGNSTVALINQLAAQNSTIENLSGKALVAETMFQTIDDGLNDITDSVAVINQIVNDTRTKTRQLEDSIQESNERLDQVEQLGAEVRNISTILEQKYIELQGTLDNLTQLIQVLEDLKIEIGPSGSLSETVKRNNNILWGILAGILGGALLIGLVIFLCWYFLYYKKKVEPLKGAAGRIMAQGGGYSAPQPQASYPPPPYSSPPGFPTNFSPYSFGYPPPMPSYYPPSQPPQVILVPNSNVTNASNGFEPKRGKKE